MSIRYPPVIILRLILIAIFSIVAPANSLAENGADAWLRYAPLDAQTAKSFDGLPGQIVVRGSSPVLNSAEQELLLGLNHMLGRSFQSPAKLAAPAILVGALDHLRSDAPSLHPTAGLSKDGYWLTTARVRNFECLVITAANDRGALYGVFALLSKIAR